MRASGAAAPNAVVFGCEGTVLSDEERAFFRDADPLGFILFARNCEAPDQLRTLVEDLRAAVGRPDAPVLIDHEGGRVSRLKPPHWRKPPAAGQIGVLAARSHETGIRAAWLHGRLIAAELNPLGIDIDCAPVLDLQFPGASNVVGNRAFGADPAMVAELGRAMADGLQAGAVLPVIKHMPGHGRAQADSHVSLPVVRTPLAELEAVDFQPFRALRDIPIGITAHVCYTAIDPDAPATQSPKVIREIIRGSIGFDGLLLTDDLSMAALAGSRAERAARALDAGCEVILHCNGNAEEMAEVMTAVRPLDAAAQDRLARAQAMRRQEELIDFNALWDELDVLLEQGTAP